ncbi:MAG: hypothetical protein IPL92_17905 [Saprospiraceae bacterium]|nr:hypothetical protein [Candidatus Opimibacter iunctus]
MNWDNLGDLSNYTSKEEISKKLQEFEQTTSSKKNDATANYEFKHLLKEGDIVIAKKGRDTYLGYGVVSSDYMFDDTKKKYKSYRNINWISKNEWTDEKGGIVVKTLTDITKYPEYVKRLTKLIGISESGLEKAQTTLSTLPLNSILYGPPGTGKTYTTVSKALQIVDPSFLKTHISDRKKLINRFQELAFDTLTEKGQIAFITFHQSMSYEDFIEGIKPIAPEGDAIQVTYEIVPGIFKQLVKAASSHGGNFNEKIEWLKGECSEAENKSPIIINTGNTEFSITYRGGKTFRVKPKKSINPDIDHPASIEKY